MQGTVALRERGRLAALLNSVLRAARRRRGWREPDPRNLRSWRQLLLGVLVTRSTRLLRLAQAVLLERRARRVKTAALGLGYFLARADFPAPGSVNGCSWPSSAPCRRDGWWAIAARCSW